MWARMCFRTFITSRVIDWSCSFDIHRCHMLWWFHWPKTSWPWWSNLSPWWFPSTSHKWRWFPGPFVPSPFRWWGTKLTRMTVISIDCWFHTTNINTGAMIWLPSRRKVSWNIVFITTGFTWVVIWLTGWQTSWVWINKDGVQSIGGVKSNLNQLTPKKKVTI